MSPTDTKKCASKLRGFTLIELIIVMAIIAILSGTLSIAIGGFRRNAKMETDNNMAKEVYMGFQNMLTQCEIKQDRTLFDADALNGGSSQSGNALKYTEIRFVVAGADISGNITVNSTYSSGSVSATLSPGSSGYEKLQKTIKDNLSFNGDGTMVVYANYEDYVVDSAVYLETTNDTQATTDLNLLTEFSNRYRTLKDSTEQQTLIKNKGAYIGAYPFSTAMS